MLNHCSCLDFEDPCAGKFNDLYEIEISGQVVDGNTQEGISDIAICSDALFDYDDDYHYYFDDDFEIESYNTLTDTDGYFFLNIYDGNKQIIENYDDFFSCTNNPIIVYDIDEYSNGGIYKTGSFKLDLIKTEEIDENYYKFEQHDIVVELSKELILYKVCGNVFSALDSSPICNIEISVDTSSEIFMQITALTSTDEDGFFCIVFKSNYTDVDFNLIFKDVDGESNGGSFQSLEYHPDLIHDEDETYYARELEIIMEPN